MDSQDRAIESTRQAQISGASPRGATRLGAGEILADDARSDDHVVESERAQIVAAALRQLPPVQREALEMAYFGGLSQSEIADCTGVAIGTIKTRIRLGMMKLRERLAPSGQTIA